MGELNFEGFHLASRRLSEAVESLSKMSRSLQLHVWVPRSYIDNIQIENLEVKEENQRLETKVKQMEESLKKSEEVKRSLEMRANAISSIIAETTASQKRTILRNIRLWQLAFILLSAYSLFHVAIKH